MGQLAGALPGEAEQLLRVCPLGKLGLPLQLGQDPDGRCVVVGRHGRLHLAEQSLQRRRIQRRIASHALDRRQGCRGGCVGVARHGVVADREPCARILRQCLLEEPVGLRATVDGPDPQAIPLLSFEHDFRHEHRRLEKLVSAVQRLGVEGSGLRFEVDGEVAHRVGGLSEENLASAADRPDDAHPQSARIHSLREDELLAFLEIKHEGNLAGHVAVDADRGENASTSRERGSSLATGTPGATPQSGEGCSCTRSSVPSLAGR